jgi:hypothetical protein
MTRVLSPEHLAKLKAGRAAKQQAIAEGTTEESGRFTCGVCGAKVDSCFAFIDLYRCGPCAQRIFDARDAGHPAGSRIMRDGTVLPPTPASVRALRNSTKTHGRAPVPPFEGVADKSFRINERYETQVLQNQQDTKVPQSEASVAGMPIGRPRQYATAAEKQRAYRARHAAEI